MRTGDCPLRSGPGISLRESYDWQRHKNGDGSVSKFLVERLDALEKRVREKTYPEVDMFLEVCCPSSDPLDFMETVCGACKCWYCELSSG